jgi:hypothetical protein
MAGLLGGAGGCRSRPGRQGTRSRHRAWHAGARIAQASQSPREHTAESAALTAAGLTSCTPDERIDRGESGRRGGAHRQCSISNVQLCGHSGREQGSTGGRSLANSLLTSSSWHSSGGRWAKGGDPGLGPVRFRMGHRPCGQLAKTGRVCGACCDLAVHFAAQGPDFARGASILTAALTGL